MHILVGEPVSTSPEHALAYCSIDTGVKLRAAQRPLSGGTTVKRIAGLVVLAWMSLPGDLAAQTYPSRTITLVNPYAAGGPADLLARTVADGIAAVLGKPVVVENKVGAGTAVAAAYVAHAQPDGYTLFIGGSPSHIIAPALSKGAKFDGINDFSFISMVGNVPNVLVVPSQRPYQTVAELIAAAKTSNKTADGSMSFASVGQGSLPQLLGLKLQQAGGFKLVHVPYGGAAPASTDLLAGRIDLAFLNLPPLLPHIQAGTLRALAIANEVRSEALPQVATMAELGFADFDMSTWYGISAPAGTPRVVVDKLASAIAETLKSPGARDKLSKAGAEMFLKGPDEYAAYVREDAKRMLPLIELAGLREN
jgi:tripartite-type tricarboxylate transporter receptor subunit TctC